MTVDPNKAPSSIYRNSPLPADNDHYDDKHLQKSRHSFQLTSLLYPLLLALLLIIGTALLAILLTRRNSCQHIQEERIGSSLGLLPKDNIVPWVSCIKTTKTSSCVCPASFLRSPLNPLHCIPGHSRCLETCTNNPHCACYHLRDVHRCQNVTRRWVKEELHFGLVERLEKNKKKNILEYPWSEHSTQQIERSLVNTKAGERLFFSSDRRTGIKFHEEDDDYLINEQWTKIDFNTTEQHITYTQLDPQTHTCRMSSISDDGAVVHGFIHKCPGPSIVPPYYLGTACQDILVLWNGSRQLKTEQQESWTLIRHHFESTIPRLPILLDPFHRYYSLYDDLMIEIKDLDGNVLEQIFTDIHMPNKFEFIDPFGTIHIANQTHKQLITSKNEEAWLEF